MKTITDKFKPCGIRMPEGAVRHWDSRHTSWDIRHKVKSDKSDFRIVQDEELEPECRRTFEMVKSIIDDADKKGISVLDAMNSVLDAMKPMSVSLLPPLLLRGEKIVVYDNMSEGVR